MDLLGLSLVSTWLNLILYSLELALTAIYFHQFPKDAPFVRVMVILFLLADTLGTISTCATTWMFAITYANVMVTFNFWTTPVLILTTAVSAMLEQSFLIYRVYALSHCKVVCGFLLLLVVTHVAFSILSSVELSIHPEFGPGIAIMATTVAFCVAAALDILIPIALIWQLRKFTSIFESTKNLVRRLSIKAISSGSVVAITGILFLILFWLQIPEYLIITSTFGRLYSLTVLVNLLGRKPRETRNHTSGSSNTDGGFNVSGLFNVELTTPSSRIEESIVLNNVNPSSRAAFPDSISTHSSRRTKEQTSLTERL
ncbi:hypothetical protein D9615_009589 [Tricholomella constricta]|uniref:DUF6534 domain-containing protein n=1 Tax=Tricholomella constricta TaxID=117010 RepID=A0A8H5GUU0_9AGAR|nr:hypothetical protein D9615_009589 [Tricholomella constricta]